MKRIAFYGGTFDPIHNGHLAIATNLLQLFRLDQFWFVPAHLAPHKRGRSVTAAFCRYAMLALATQNEPKIKISTVELDAPEKPYTVQTLRKLKDRYRGEATIFFVMGADSWNEIDTWREWQELLQMTNHIVVTRPGYEIAVEHVTPEIQRKIVDLRGLEDNAIVEITNKTHGERIFITDAVRLEIASSEIRRLTALGEIEKWRKLVAPATADYIEKYNLYL